MRIWILVCVALALGQANRVHAEPVEIGGVRYEVVATIPTPEAPHGACFTADGSLAYVACSGGGAIAVIDMERLELLRTISVPGVPLDVYLSPDESSLIFSRFDGDALFRVPVAGGDAESITTLGQSPSLFSRPGKHGSRFIVSERADIVTEVGPVGEKLRTWPVGDRPYPAGITHDGILLFVPGRDGDSVTVIDTLNNKVVKTVPTPDAPQGGAVTHDDVYYIVAAGGADALAFINTASFEIVATVTDGVGPRPFSVTMVPESPHALVNNAGGKTISVLDVRKREIMGAIEVGSIPIVVSVHPDGRHILVSCEGDHHVAVLRVETPSAPRGGALTEVVVMGMIHSGHRTSERYGLDTVEALVRAIGPDDLCVELPPNRFEAAMSGYLATGELTEQRARVFPEYTDVVFPLQKEMGFTIIPTAGWTKEMNDYRRARLDEISEDPARADQWGKHERAMDTMEEALDSAGESDDPRFIHTDRYDAIIDAGYSGPYNEFFNDDLADGGWDNINRKHYSNIARHLDSVRGQGRRVLITYGAAHKGWFLRELRKRDDVRLLDVREFLDQIEGGEDGGE